MDAGTAYLRFSVGLCCLCVIALVIFLRYAEDKRYHHLYGRKGRRQ